MLYDADMRKLAPAVLISVFAILVLVGCSTESVEIRCFDTPDDVVQNVSNTLLPFGEGPKLRNSKLLKSEFHPSTFVVAADLVGLDFPGNDDIAIWALYDTADGERTTWVNNLAHANSIAGRGLEPQFDTRDEEVLEIRDCVRATFTSM
jgi:hypothetical protein